MFVILGILGVVGMAFFSFRTYKAHDDAENMVMGVSFAMFLLAVAIFVTAWLTPQGQFYWEQLITTGRSGSWLIVDNSGGKTMRHWVLKNSYVGSSLQSDGWKFKTEDGFEYISGDSFVHRIKGGKDNYKKFVEGDYKKRYSIPQDNVALH